MALVEFAHDFADGRDSQSAGGSCAVGKVLLPLRVFELRSEMIGLNGPWDFRGRDDHAFAR